MIIRQTEKLHCLVVALSHLMNFDAPLYPVFQFPLGKHKTKQIIIMFDEVECELNEELARPSELACFYWVLEVE